MSRVGLNALLYVATMLAAALLVVAVVTTVGGDDDDNAIALPVDGVVQLDESSEDEQERYSKVLESATTVATAFVNIRYDDAQASIEAVMAGATGAFRDQYAKSTEGVISVLEDNKSVMTGEVLWSGVVAQDKDSATVIVATTGTVANVQTENEPVARNFRLQLELVLEKGKWLTSDLQFVA